MPNRRFHFWERVTDDGVEVVGLDGEVSALKFTYTAKTGTFKGSFKAYSSKCDPSANGRRSRGRLSFRAVRRAKDFHYHEKLSPTAMSFMV